MKKIVILAGLDLQACEGIKSPNKEFNSSVSKIIRNFAHRIARSALSLCSVKGLLLALAAVATVISVAASAIASDTEGAGARLALAASALVASAAIAIYLWKDGYFKPYNEENF